MPQDSRSIAVVGMAGRFPGAPDVESLWRLMADGGDAIGPIPPDRWDADAQLDPEKQIQAEGGFLDGIDLFDPTFFGISPREAEDIDPQQRVMLETVWRALEDAGQRTERLAGSRTGVYVGVSWHDYEIVRKELGAGATQHSEVGTAFDVIASRVSYFLKLKGPSLVTETGCSSALVALDLAVRGLQEGDLDGAIVGGVNLILAPDSSIGLTHFGGLSPQARCKAFSADADGFVRGEGVAAVYLKTLERAQADGDRIHAVIKATVVNNDGGGDSLVTPSFEGQQDLLRRAYDTAGIPVEKLRYIEAHGTGTKRGDPIEARAIGTVLGTARGPDAEPLVVGSVKTNIGHLEAAAGIAGLVKGVLVLRHRTIPPSLHSQEPNPEIPFEELNLRVASETIALDGHGPIYVGVNSFGWGGTNAHAVLESPPERPEPGTPPPALPAVLAVSAHQDAALRERVEDLRDHVASGENALHHVAGALARNRDHFPLRAAFVADDDAAFIAAADAFLAGADEDVPGVVTGRGRAVGRVAFVFPGQGSQWEEMGRELYAADPVFAETMRRCAEALSPHVDWDLVDLVSGASELDWCQRVDMLQPVLWAVSVGLAQMWRAAGIEPDVVIGHSQGEVTAATVAGILSYEDAAMIIARRSALARRTAGRGRMLAVDLGIEAARIALKGFEELVSVAVNNGPNSCVLSGDVDAVLALKEILEAEGVFCRLVNVDYASHSPQMDEITDDLLTALDGVRPREGAIPLMSTVSVRGLSGPEMDARYWADNLRQPVLFADAMGELLAEGVTHVIEISPHPILVSAVDQLIAQRSDPPAMLTTLRRDEGGPADLAAAFARAYAAGLEPLDWLPENPSVTLPGYPWQRGSFWVAEGRRRVLGRNGLEFDLVPAPAEADAWQGDVELDIADLTWLPDHKVHEATVLPAAAMVALAIGAARARTGTIPEALTGFRFKRDLTLTGDHVRLNVYWRDDVAEGGSLTLSSLSEDATAWTEHATTRVEHRSAASTRSVPSLPGALMEKEPVDNTAFYNSCAARGLIYGPAFRGVSLLRLEGDAALGQIRLDPRWHAGARPHTLHPAVLDAAFQVCLALVPGDRAVVPVSIEGLTLHDDLAEPITELWSHAVRRGPDAFDLFLFALDRRPLATVTGLTMTELGSDAETGVDTERLHRMEFRPEDHPEAGPLETDTSLLVCGPTQDSTQGLVDALRATGARATGVQADASGGWDGPLNAAGEIDMVVYLAGTGSGTEKDGLLELIGLVRACRNLARPPRLVVLTTGAQLVEQGDRPDPSSAVYWGFTRVLRREHAELSPTVIDADPAGPDWAGCAAALLASDDEDQVALRSGTRYVGRLVRGQADDPDSASGAPLWRTPAQPFRLVPDQPGFFDGVAPRPLARRLPGPGQIEVEVSAAGLNFIDVMKTMGTYPDPVGGRLLGGECAGRVSAVGPGTVGYRLGDRVVACAFGAAASHVTVPVEHTRPIRAELDDATAATLPLAMVTAWYALSELARLAPGETVLIHSAAGGLGLAAVQVAQSLGATVIATASGAKKQEHLRGLGVEQVFHSRDLSWVDGVRAATGGLGVDVVLNSLTGRAIPAGLDLLAEDGRFIEVGKKDIYAERGIGLGAFRKGITLASVDIAGLMDRRPARFAKVFAEVWEKVEAGVLAPIPVASHPFAEAAEALRTMARGDHIGKFVLTDPAAVTGVVPEPMPEGRLRPDGGYLITGGLGALGLSLADHLVEKGAGAIALLGRSAPSAEAEERIAAMRRDGAHVRVLRADTADPEALGRALDEFRADPFELRGVVHAAGVLDDAMIETLRQDQVSRVLAPKVEGARNLDAATAGDPLDFFVLFSSAATLVGNAGQAAYAAGNAFLDALAQNRRARGLPGVSVQWGPFAEIGLAAGEENRGLRLEERGMGGFSADEAWAALTHFLDRGDPVVGYVPLNLRQWFDSYPDTAAQKSWEQLAGLSRDGAGALSRGSFLELLHATAESEWSPLIEDKIRELASRVLRLEAAQIEQDTPFKALGLDSLMSLELRNRLESAFGMKLSPTLLWTYGSVRALTGALSERLSVPAAD